MKTAIVLGVGRCGSSLVAHILHTLGVYMGPTFIEADEYNKQGYWEDSTIMSIHERMLKSINRGWWNPPRTQDEILMVSDAAEFALLHTFGKRVDQAKAEGKDHWGWKDPRTHWFLPLYSDRLPDPHYIFVHRDPLSIAQSVFHRDKNIVKTLDNAIAIVSMHYTQLSRLYFHSYPRLHVSYRDILVEPRKIVHQIDDFLGMKARLCTINSAIDCVRPELRKW